MASRHAFAKLDPTSADGLQPFSGGLQRKNLEPITVLPGRARAFSADVCAILDEFESSLRTSAASSSRVGAFPIFRKLFAGMKFSMAIEQGKGERMRDVFQLACGICWRELVGTQRLPRRTGVVFLVYMLWHTQSPFYFGMNLKLEPASTFAVPVDMTVMEALVALRRDCTRQQVFLECPEILRKLVEGGVLSVGILATCRNLYFDRVGRLGERWSKEKELDAASSAVAPQAAVLRTKRLRIERQSTARGENSPGPLTAETGSSTEPGAIPASSSMEAFAPVGSAAEVLYDGQEVFEFSDTIRLAEDYHTRLDASGQTALAPASSAPEALAALDQAADTYQRDRPPEPSQLVPGEVESSNRSVPQGPRQYSRKKRRIVADTTSSSDSGDPLIEQMEDGKSLKGIRRKYRRQSHQLGIGHAMNRMQATPKAPVPLQHHESTAASSNAGAPGGVPASAGDEVDGAADSRAAAAAAAVAAPSALHVSAAGVDGGVDGSDCRLEVPESTDDMMDIEEDSE